MARLKRSMTKYKNKYRIETTRLKYWDYRNNGYYYVTILTKQKIKYFGFVKDGKVKLNVLGKIAAEEWLKTKEIRKNVDIDEWIIMPNHLHGILILDNNNPSVDNDENAFRIQANSLGSIIGQFKSIVTKRIRDSGENMFCWQPGYYEHIIRSEKALYNIRRYIKLNPLKWELDEYNT